MADADLEYNRAIDYILGNGEAKSDRTGTGTISSFGIQMRFDISDVFPLLTTKKVYFKGIVHELLWIISGSTNIEYLTDNDVHIWDEWADTDGNLGPVYGKQLRNWRCTNGEHIDQLDKVINQIISNPDSRRHIITLWNPADIEVAALPPCHILAQFYVSDNRLSCHLYQRSGDMFLGVPFNIASYSLLTMMIAQVTGLVPHEFVHTIGDAHIYSNHLNQVQMQLRKEPKPGPRVIINKNVTRIDDFIYDDIQLVGYDPHPAIKAPVAV